jgi:hypothetical protein
MWIEYDQEEIGQVLNSKSWELILRCGDLIWWVRRIRKTSTKEKWRSDFGEQRSDLE